MLTLIVASIKNKLRNGTSLFFSLIFPAIFIAIFSLFDFEGGVELNVIVVNPAQTQIGTQLEQGLQKMEGFGYLAVGNLDEAKKLLEEGQDIEFSIYQATDSDDEEKVYETVTEERRPSVVVYLPPDLDSRMEEAITQQTTLPIQIFYDNTQQSQYSPIVIMEGILADMTDLYSQQVFQYQGRNLFTLQKKGLSVKEISYFDFIVPGIIGMGLMQSGIMGVAATMAAYREKKILKRIQATPLPMSKFLAGEIMAFLLISFLQTTILLILSTQLLGANIYGSIPLIYLLAVIGNITFFSLGFIAAAIAKTAQGAATLGNIIAMPMMFLSGVFFPRESLPAGIKAVATALPLSPLLDALRMVAINEATIYDIKWKFLLISIWAVVSFTIAVRLFKIREE